MASFVDCEIGMNIALSLLPLPPATRQKLNLLGSHWQDLFFCMMQETMKNQAGDLPTVDYEHVSEALHKSLFDLQILTLAS